MNAERRARLLHSCLPRQVRDRIPLIIGVHFRSPKRTILCASLLSFLSWLKAAIAGAAIDRKTTSDFATTVFLIRFLRSKDWPDLGAPGLAKRYSRPACEA